MSPLGDYMHMLNPDLLQLNPIHFQNSQWARAPGPGPKNVLGTMGPGPDPRTFFGPRARGPGPLTSLNIISLELEEIWVEHIHIAPQRGYAVRVNKY